MVLHGFGGNKSGHGQTVMAEQLTQWGYVTMRFDFRGCGESEGEHGRILCLDQPGKSPRDPPRVRPRQTVARQRWRAVNGVFLQAIAVEEFQPMDQFLDKVNEFVSLIKSVQRAPGHEEIFLPGERARRREAKQLKEGIDVDETTWTQLKELATEFAVTLPNLV